MGIIIQECRVFTSFPGEIDKMISHKSINNISINKERPLMKIIPVFFFFFVCSAVYAENTPSNEELYQMILELKKDQGRLKHEAEQARAEAENAKQELEVTRKVLDATQEKLKETEVQVLQTQEIVAKTQEGLAETKAEMGTGPSSSVVRIKEMDRGPYAKAELLVKRQENDRLTYALIDANTPDDEVLTAVNIETDYEPGFLIGAGYLFNSGTEAFINFSYLNTSAGDAVTDPPGAADLNCHLCQPSEIDIDRDDDIDSATAEYDLAYHVFDAGFAQNLGIGDQIDLRLGGGIRVAFIDDELNALFVNGGDTVRVIRENDFWGIGPRATLDVNWNIPNTRFAIFGMLGGSLIYGENDFLHDARDVPLDDISRISSDAESRIIPVFEGGLGVNYAGNAQGVKYDLSLGYEFESWVDLLSSASFDDDTDDNLFTREDMNLDLHGVILRGEVIW